MNRAITPTACDSRRSLYSPVKARIIMRPSPLKGSISPSRPGSAYYNSFLGQLSPNGNDLIEESMIASPALNRKITKIVQQVPKSAYDNVKVIRIADGAGYMSRSNNLRKYLKPNESVISKLRQLTNNKPSVNNTLERVFYAQQKQAVKLDIDPGVILNHTLQELSQKKKQALDHHSLKKKIITRISKSDSQSLFEINQKQDPFDKLKPKKLRKGDKPYDQIKVYTSTQKETINLWRLAREQGQDVRQNVINGLFKTGEPIQTILDANDVRERKRNRSRRTSNVVSKSLTPNKMRFTY